MTAASPDAISAEFEARLSRDERRRLGVFNTPWSVAIRLAGVIDRPCVVCDPSCGTGTLLLAAAERLVALGLSRAQAARSLVGIDVDPAAIAVARDRLASWSGGVTPWLVAGDALTMEERWDVVVANPPFVDGSHVQFLSLVARSAGRAAILLPASVLATREAHDAREAVRAAGLGISSVARVGPVFDASVDTLVVVLEPGAPLPAGPTRSSLLADEVPEVELLTAGVLGDLCDAVAGFRQHFYGLRGHVREGGGGLPLVTSGSIEPGAWGGRPVRFDGVRWDDPRVALDDVDEPVGSWFRALLRPKVVVATQTRVIEAAPDPDGVVVPGVPVISVVPRAGVDDVWRVLAVLLAPPVTAWAIRRFGGAALVADAVKLGCGQVRQIPLPIRCGAWTRAASLVRSPSGVVEAGALMCDAYGVGEEVHAWWAARLR